MLNVAASYRDQTEHSQHNRGEEYITRHISFICSVYVIQLRLSIIWAKSRLIKNSSILQKAALSTSHRLLRCQVVLTKRLFKVLKLSIVRIFVFLSFVTIWVLEFCHNLSFLNFVAIWMFEFGHNLSFWVLSQFKFLSFHNFSLWVLSQF